MPTRGALATGVELAGLRGRAREAGVELELDDRGASAGRERWYARARSSGGVDAGWATHARADVAAFDALYQALSWLSSR